MNTNTGEFVDQERSETWMQRIGVGEVVKIKGGELEVVSIGRREITLRLLSQEDRVVAKIDFGDLADVESKRQRGKMLKYQR